MRRYFVAVVLTLAYLFLCGYTQQRGYSYQGGYSGYGGYSPQSGYDQRGGGYTHLEGAPGYLSAPGGGSVRVFGDLEAIKSGLTRGDPISAMDQNTICNALDGTLVEVNEDSRTHIGWVGDFMKVLILEGSCQGKVGWVEINTIRKR